MDNRRQGLLVRWQQNRLQIRYHSIQMRRYMLQRQDAREPMRLMIDDYLRDQGRMQRLARQEVREMRLNQYHPMALRRQYPFNPDIALDDIEMAEDDDVVPVPPARRRATSLDVNMHKQINVPAISFEKIQIKGLYPEVYEAPPTAYQPHGNEEPLVQQKRLVQERIAVLSRMKTSLQAIPGDDRWATQLVLNRSCIDTPVPIEGGLIALHGLEELVLGFLDAPTLLKCTLTCVRWSRLCRQDSLWEKLLVSPTEGYNLRELLSCPQPVPAIQVFMLFHTSGLAAGPLFNHQEFVIEGDDCPPDAVTVTTSARHRDLIALLEATPVASVHVARLLTTRSNLLAALSFPTEMAHLHGSDCVPLKAWLTKHAPLSADMLRSFSAQLLHGCVALDAAGLVHTDLSLKHVLVFNPDGPLPLLRIDGHAALERKARAFDHESAVWSLIFTTQTREESRWKNLLCSFLYAVLDVCLEGRLANLRQQSLMHCLAMDRHAMPRDFRSLVEYGAFLLHHNRPMAHLLRHPYLTRAAWDNVDWLRELHPPRDQATYLENIIAWYAANEPPAAPAPWPVPVSRVGPDCLGAAVGEGGLLANRFTCIRAPADATSYWMQALASSQGATLVRLDLSALELSSSTILQGLSLLPHITDLKLPKAMLRESNIERFVVAFANSLLPALTTVEDAFLAAVGRMEDSYRKQLEMVDFLLQAPVRAG
ncbi:F-box protein [Achlya hypogyna]|uniref:F-box protein n=1 Tax=Achlya hypogyna TaxID=1202772 RepID=A0A1V9YI65_ACHHY|nr:F-box protein [Achlya hypogyna]